MLDSRVNLFRPDLADERLRGMVQSERFASGVEHLVVTPVMSLRKSPNQNAPLESQGLYGEIVRVFEVESGWAWGQLERDRYVGYFPSEAVKAGEPSATHRVSLLQAFVFSEPSIKAPTRLVLPFGAAVTVVEELDEFVQLSTGGYCSRCCVVPMAYVFSDYIEVAERFLWAPYLWGGRTSSGIDCSGLVQVSMHASGRDCPRDSDMQMREVGSTVPIKDNAAQFRRGDLVFWRGHVGIMFDHEKLLHANATGMCVQIENLRAVVNRKIEREGCDILCVRRP